MYLWRAGEVNPSEILKAPHSATQAYLWQSDYETYVAECDITMLIKAYQESLAQMVLEILHTMYILVLFPPMCYTGV